MLSLKEIKEEFESVVEDSRLTLEEKQKLKKTIKTLDKNKLNFLRNEAFDVSRQQLLNASGEAEILATIRWLEQVIKMVDRARGRLSDFSSAHFSPGEECRSKIIELCNGSKKTIDICVFTISDDYLTQAIIDAHRRGLRVRIITDNHKSEDMGSDIERLIEHKISLVMDMSSYHMHHKFALFDNHNLLNGSFNWTRSASKNNEENIVVLRDVSLIDQFSLKFNELWDEYSE